jgi:hypothetical protein
MLLLSFDVRKFKNQASEGSLCDLENFRNAADKAIAEELNLQQTL